MLQKLLNLDLFKKSAEDDDIQNNENPNNNGIRDEILQHEKTYEAPKPAESVQETESAKLLKSIKTAIATLPETKQKTPFSKLELTTRTVNIFQREEINTPYDFLNTDSSEILK